jgi:cobalt-zinc-cadmium efflux system outer membrane protein
MRQLTKAGTRWLTACGVGLTVGCAADRVAIPNGHLPPPTGLIDGQTSAALTAGPPLATVSARPALADPAKKPPFDLPPTLPGAGAPPVTPPQFDKDTPAAERDRKVKEAYPALTPVSATAPAAGQPLALADLTQLARTNSPAVRQAQADADAAYGQVIQAGLHPNPTIGYQADQWQPGPRDTNRTRPNAGQQGGYVNQLIKTAGKLTLAQQVAGYDYVNALVAVRKAEVDVTTAVRAAYFNAMVAQEGVRVNTAVAELADEVYALQLKQVAAGQAAGYEPLQLYAQAVQARTAVAQAEAVYRAAWLQLAAAVGQPDLPPAPLAGRADIAPPVFEQESLKARVTVEHTDVLTARNAIAQAQRNLVLQRKLRVPDLQTNTYQQYDNAAQAYQFGLQLGITLPVSDRNQGNIRTAQAKIASTGHQLAAAQNALAGKLAEAFGRYEAAAATAASYRDKILPSQAQAYRSLVRRYQVEPDKVGFNDIVVAQQSLGQSFQAYLTALGGQWQAVVDVANAAQLDDLYPPVATVPPPSK